MRWSQSKFSLFPFWSEPSQRRSCRLRRPWQLRPAWAVALLAASVSPSITAIPAQAETAVPQATLGRELQSLASRAAVVFSGQVLSIERHGDAVEIAFQVEEPVRGAVAATYTVREWAGLWPPGQWRYTVGERALVFLHPASAAGLASPVDGADGVVPVVVQGADAPALLDVRRLSAAMLRAPGTPLPDETQAAIPLASAVALVTETTTNVFEPVRLPLPGHHVSQWHGRPVLARPPATIEPGVLRAPVLSSQPVLSGQPVLVRQLGSLPGRSPAGAVEDSRGPVNPAGRAAEVRFATR